MADIQQVDLLRLRLPPLHQLDTGAVHAAWRNGTSDWTNATFETMAELASRLHARRVEVAPHPADVAMTPLEMPALPPKRMRAAVLGAVELLALGSPETLAVGFGVRSASGRVPVAWMGAEALRGIIQTLRGHGVSVSAVVPPHAFLPVSAPVIAGAPHDPGVAMAMRVDDWAVLRVNAQEGVLHPLPPGDFDPARAEERLRGLLPEGARIRWMAEPDMSGEAAWAWPMGHGANTEARGRWAPAVLGWSAAVAVVWAVGLHLQASRMADEGKGLRRQMATLVKAAFPEVSVVLNPLQQARQLREARRAGAGVLQGNDPAGLLRASTVVLVQAEGQVQRLDLQDGVLRVTWRDGHTLSQEELQALQARAKERGLLVQSDARGVRLQMDPTQTVPAASPTAQVADASGTTGSPAGLAAPGGAR